MRNHFKSKEDTFIDGIAYIILAVVFILTLYPFLNMLAISLNDSMDTMLGGITIIPRKFTLYTYCQILKESSVYKAALVSLERTVLNTTLNVSITIITAYILSRKEFVFNKFLNLMLVITMYINAGLIPGYILIKQLGLMANFWVYVIPTLVNVFNIIIVRTYIEGLPDSIVESARIDGAGEMQIIARIIAPLIIPAIAVVVIFVSIGNWNSWFDTYLYGGGKKHMITLQFKLTEMLMSATSQISNTNSGSAAVQAANSKTVVTPQSMRAVMTMVVTIPIMLVYPFLQKYFVSGITLGGVKE